MTRRLIIDGNSVYEIDEDCLRRQRPPENCSVYQYFDENKTNEQNNVRGMHRRKAEK